MESWNAAYVRVEDYLRAHRIHNRLHQSRLIQDILERAALRHAVQPLLDPTTLAAEETEALMDSWFGKVLVKDSAPHERIAIEGRVALLLSDGSQKWPCGGRDAGAFRKMADSAHAAAVVGFCSRVIRTVLRDALITHAYFF
ncbi:MAG: hypothetical protein EBU32_06200 [Opitutaceae bacterium]|nr:hypothetical protein [Opitutaceae bacterium]